jgi:hypothetical protein
MRGFLLGVVVATAAIQAPQRPPPLPLYGMIDLPSTFVVNDYTGDFKISGWAMDCRTGQTPPFVTVYDSAWGTAWPGLNPGQAKPTNTVLNSFLVFRDEARPDVQAWAAPHCPGASEKVGYSLYPNATLTPGYHSLHVMWTAGDGVARSSSVWVYVDGFSAVPAPGLRQR